MERGTGTGLWWLFVSLSRGLAAFVSLYSLLSLVGTVFLGAYNQNSWWIDLSFYPRIISVSEQIALTVALAFFAVHVPCKLGTRIVVAAPVLFALVTAIHNTISVYSAAAEGIIALGFALPFSLFVAIGLFCILVSILFGAQKLASSQASRPMTAGVMICSFLCAVIAFPVGQMHCFGTTDYHEPVDAVVVFGAQVHPDGTPSPVLQDRLDTAIQFYKEGYAPLMVMSGGIDVEGTSEAVAMKEYVVEHGVPSQNIILDENGSNTQQSARNTVETLQVLGLTRVATVSNFYHLARIKMLYLSEGLDVITVPSVPVKDPLYPGINVLREIPGWWYYWFLNLVE